MIIVSMTLIQFFVIDPTLGFEAFYSGLTAFEFILLILSTLCVTIGGYLINDLFDMDADRLNKPGKNQVGLKFPVASVQVMYWFFTAIGVLLGAWLCLLLDQLAYALIFVFAAGLLWFYSERYQCIPIVGNVVIAFLSSLSFGLVWLFDFFALRNDAPSFTSVQGSFSMVNRLVLIYMGFAFLVSLIREVVKDIEDKEGDERYGCETFAVSLGSQVSKRLAMAITVITLLFSVWTQMFFLNAEFYMLFGYFLLIDILLLTLIVWLIQAKHKSHYHRLATFTKLVMLIGVISMILVKFEVSV
jgi:4-hydroxybenzoate polyprenyltransferase